MGCRCFGGSGCGLIAASVFNQLEENTGDGIGMRGPGEMAQGMAVDPGTSAGNHAPRRKLVERYRRVGAHMQYIDRYRQPVGMRVALGVARLEIDRKSTRLNSSQ